ncbi:hypothetical protein [Streptomyces sp. 3214.6]|uniref:hypothetical protein n=1 Tax=Streptomyces sp. 3214.6 TaxID=1882757 RepID=UPI00090A64FA|nr:hypothetical protein [Streptomyces sp. 3214.6]SHH95911.1 hypothetical protein SAMN05444521_2862 [Streptomyces sp. 3214.6]
MRTALRTALAIVALVGTATASVVTATATAAGAATTAASSTSSACVATKTIPSVFGGWKVKLVNSADNGASAKLLDEKGHLVSTVDQSRTVDSANGLRITGVLSARPVFGQRSEGGSTPWKSTAFPVLSADCTQSGRLARTLRLDSRTAAQIFKISASHYQARVYQSGKLVRFIDAHGRAGAALFGSRTLVLNPDGTTATWTGAKTAANPRLGRYKLANGATVKLVKRAGVYGAQLTTSHGTFSVEYAKGRPSVQQDDVTLVVLGADGTLSGYVYGKTQKPPVYLGA